jgi:hypothetical protein
MISWVLPIMGYEFGAPSADGAGVIGAGGGASGGGWVGGDCAPAVSGARINAEATSEAVHSGLRNLLVMFYSSLESLKFCSRKTASLVRRRPG